MTAVIAETPLPVGDDDDKSPPQTNGNHHESATSIEDGEVNHNGVKMDEASEEEEEEEDVVSVITATPNGVHHVSKSEPPTSPTSPTVSHALYTALLVEKEQLEAELREAQRERRVERDEKRRLQMQVEAQEELKAEFEAAERRWREKWRLACEERDAARAHSASLEEHLDVAKTELNRAVAYRLELEEQRQRLQAQYDGLIRDYEDTMEERGTVLEENTRLTEERDRLKQSVRHLSTTLHNMINAHKNDSQVQQLTNKLEHTRRLLQLDAVLSQNTVHSSPSIMEFSFFNDDTDSQEDVNMDETAMSESRRVALEGEARELRARCLRAESERDEAIRRFCEVDNGHGGFSGAADGEESLVDNWTTHAIDIRLPLPKPNLGILLSGGRGDDRMTHAAPLYVKEVLVGSPLESLIRRLDQILMVNDIDVRDMDQRSVQDILRNSHHLKMVIQRRNSGTKMVEISFNSGTDAGVELQNGVFVNRLDPGGPAERAGLRLGNRLLYVNNVPVFDAAHAEEMIKSSGGHVILGLLPGLRRADKDLGGGSIQDTSVSAKQRNFINRVHEKLFRRGSPSVASDKARAIIAKANIDAQQSDLMHSRQHSLRIPNVTRAPAPSPLNRTGSLRGPPPALNDPRLISETLDRLIQQRHLPKTLTAPTADPGTWPKCDVGMSPTSMNIPNSPSTTERLVPLHRRRVHHRPSIPPFTPPPTVEMDGRETAFSSTSRPDSWYPPSTPSIDAIHYAHSPRSQATRSVVYSPAPSLPQPPPYPGPGREFGLDLENAESGGVVISSVKGKAYGRVRRGERLLDVQGINMRSADKLSARKILEQISASNEEVTVLVGERDGAGTRRVEVPRWELALCGGNNLGILVERGGEDLIMGDHVLKIDGEDVSKATLEDATAILQRGKSEVVVLVVEHGAGRIEKLKSGEDGDGFYVRVNVERPGANQDELELKQGEILYVDKTLFMGERGRWKAWKVDREGRQIQCGIVPSASVLQHEEARKSSVASAKGSKALRSQPSISRAVYERVEPVASNSRRPVVLLGALVSPFIAALVDEHHNKFKKCVADCSDLTGAEVEAKLASGEFIEARRRDKLYEVISATSLRFNISQGLHCILDVGPNAIQRMHAMRIFPIVIKIKFKSAKQVKELGEECGERIGSRSAKEFFDKVIAYVDQEQRKTVWVTIG